MERDNKIFNTVAYVILILISIVCLLPLFWMITTSLKTHISMFQIPPEWIPANPQWKNYITAFTFAPFARYALNTFILEAFIVTGSVISATLVAYGFARFRFKGREVLFLLMLGTMLIPGQITLIPQFVIFSKLGWVNHYLPLILPAFLGGTPFYIFLTRQYLLSTPIELDEAAKIDGAGSFQTLWKILMPMLRPSMVIIAVFTFQGVYNDFINPLIYLNDQEKFTLAVGLASFSASYGNEYNYLMAAGIVVLIPLIIMYYFAQKQMIKGIATMGIKA